MTNRELLKELIGEAEELLIADEMAFDLTADVKELQKAHDLIWDFNTRVKAEAG